MQLTQAIKLGLTDPSGENAKRFEKVQAQRDAQLKREAEAALKATFKTGKDKRWIE